ncbi:hypothetical protein KY309_03750 [Candidatus Woesearchaeota archaeon]|nr:hypothetical protein [Candidatus Woesearchaeota archaeon]
MKILKWLVFGLVLASVVGAVDFPGPFADADRLVIVVADEAPADDVIAGTDVANALGPSVAIGTMKLASEIDDITDYNSILLGSPCYHPIINQLMGYPERCQISGIKLIKFDNGNVALVIMGQNSEIRKLVKEWISGMPVEPPSIISSGELCNRVSLNQVVRVSSGNVYEISLVYTDGNNAKFKINGEITESLVLGDSYNLADGSHFIVKDLSRNTAEFCITSAQVQTSPAPETYDSCMSRYESKAREYETWRQNIPEARRIREEGLRVCGEKFGRPVPPVRVETEFDRCMNEGYKNIYSLPESEAGAAKEELLSRCEPLRAKLPEEQPEFKACMKEVEAFKQDLVARFGSQAPPEDMMRKYEGLHDKCRVLLGWTVPRPVETVAPPNVERAPVEKPCVGCKKESMCLQHGIRFVDENNRPVYCDFDGVFKAQKQLGESCQNNYECLSNSCSQKCISYEERIEAVERELKEQRGLIDRMWGFFKRLFGG